MPRYPFRCGTCGLEFEVSRSIKDATAGVDAACPSDGARAERIFTVPKLLLSKPMTPPPPSAQPSHGYSHHGHSHGPGTGAHSH
jgi:putative FmdB family regulatory protein